MHGTQQNRGDALPRFGLMPIPCARVNDSPLGGRRAARGGANHGFDAPQSTIRHSGGRRAARGGANHGFDAPQSTIRHSGGRRAARGGAKPRIRCPRRSRPAPEPAQLTRSARPAAVIKRLATEPPLNSRSPPRLRPPSSRRPRPRRPRRPRPRPARPRRPPAPPRPRSAAAGPWPRPRRRPSAA